MGQPAALVTVEEIARSYDFGSSHPLRPERVLLTYDNVRALGLTQRPGVQEIVARAATEEEIVAVHDQEFVDIVKGIDDGSIPEREGLAFGLGTPDDPIFDGMHVAASAVCGASITAAEQVAAGRAPHAFNPAGGLHHARRREASGFCIYNDPAVAIAKILELQPHWRVLYLDVDVHHGDGVQWIFYDDPRVATMSLHQSGRYLYPGTGFEDEIGEGAARGSAINVPLMPYTGDDDYLWALQEVLNPVAAGFKPDVLVTQLGADTHHGDPLANLGLTLAAYPRIGRVIHDVVHDHCDGRWVATGGGGYQAETVVPKVWTMYFAEMCDAGDAVPPEWLEDRRPEEVSRSFRRELERSVGSVLDAVLPRLTELAAAGT